MKYVTKVFVQKEDTCNKHFTKVVMYIQKRVWISDYKANTIQSNLLSTKQIGSQICKLYIRTRRLLINRLIWIYNVCPLVFEFPNLN